MLDTSITTTSIMRGGMERKRKRGRPLLRWFTQSPSIFPNCIKKIWSKVVLQLSWVKFILMNCRSWLRSWSSHWGLERKRKGERICNRFVFPSVFSILSILFVGIDLEARNKNLPSTFKTFKKCLKYFIRWHGSLTGALDLETEKSFLPYEIQLKDNFFTLILKFNLKIIFSLSGGDWNNSLV